MEFPQGPKVPLIPHPQSPTYLCLRAVGWGGQNSLFLRWLARAGDLGRTWKGGTQGLITVKSLPPYSYQEQGTASSMEGLTIASPLLRQQSRDSDGLTRTVSGSVLGLFEKESQAECPHPGAPAGGTLVIMCGGYGLGLKLCLVFPCTSTTQGEVPTQGEV